MDSLLHLFKKKNTQQFIAFIFILLTLWLIAYPLVSEKTASTNENNSRQTVVENSNTNSTTQTTSRVKNKIVQFAVNTGSSNVQVYQKMDSKSIPMGEISQGQYLLSLHKLDNGWIQVQYNEQVGYVEENDHILLTTLMKGYANGGLKIYQTAEKNTKEIGTIPDGEIFYLLEDVSDKTLKIRYKETEGYVDSDSSNYTIELIQEILNKQAGLPTTIDSNKMFVTKLKETPIYSQSSITSDLIGTVDKGTQFVYEDREGDFYKVSVGNGK